MSWCWFDFALYMCIWICLVGMLWKDSCEMNGAVRACLCALLNSYDLGRYLSPLASLSLFCTSVNVSRAPNYV